MLLLRESRAFYRDISSDRLTQLFDVGDEENWTEEQHSETDKLQQEIEDGQPDVRDVSTAAQLSGDTVSVAAPVL